jgi:biopolymer transport protein ExbD
MSWKVRHEGSPQFKELDGPEHVLAGVRDGLWEPTDEVQGPNETQWQALEIHPVFAEAIAELAEPPPKPHVDETHLDFNPLIDVALVLLVFFMLTTAYTAIHRLMDLPPSPDDKPNTPPQSMENIKDKMIVVNARSVNGQPKIKVDDEEVTEATLEAKLREAVKLKKKTEMFLDAKEVKYGLFAKILDEAKGAGVTRVHTPLRKEKAARPAAPPEK